MYGQQCQYTLSGVVNDEGTGEPLSYVNVFIQELSESTMTDEEGKFEFRKLCHGDVHLILSHVGCQPLTEHVHLHEDIYLEINMPHTSVELSQVTVESSAQANKLSPAVSINRGKIESNIEDNLATLLENETGVFALKTGAGIAKPIIHGLYGNRVSIFNNGIKQSGQQWGNGHSPEIDPLSAEKIQVIKGVNTLEYTGGNLGGLILVEPSAIKKEPHVHGQLHYAYETNGRGHTAHARVGQYSHALGWRILATTKHYGDRRAPDYYLNNTGVREYNLAVQLEKQWNPKFDSELYVSTFNTQLGVLRGAHISNLTDLEFALAADEPYFTEPDFSYGIDAPRQNVSHHLIKVKSTYFIDENQSLKIQAGTQLNNRREFDVRRGGRTERPAMSLLQQSYHADIQYTLNASKNNILKIGNQLELTNNTNNPETGILPLIPDYIALKNGLYATYYFKYKFLDISIGSRYDIEQQNAVTFSNDIPREILRFNRIFHTTSQVASLRTDINDKHIFNFESGFVTRAPATNELYSFGLHQGVSGIEEGNINLKIEQSIKSTLEYNWKPNTKLSLTTLAYFHHINNYIFLDPTNEFRVTIRGAFPVFEYKQTDAQLFGLDASLKYDLLRSLQLELGYSYLNGQDRSNSEPLVFMPPNRITSRIQYQHPSSIRLGSTIQLINLKVEADFKHIFEQVNLNSDQDFTAVPSQYSLLGIKLSSGLVTKKTNFNFYIKVENLFNTSYRDYLNRQRYFADDLGRSIIIGTRYSF